LSHTTSYSGGQFAYPLEIHNTSVTGTINTDQWYNYISLNLSLNNIKTNQYYSNVYILNVVTDNPSINLINSITTLNNLSTAYTQGCRVWSANPDYILSMTPSGIVPYVYITNGSSIPNNTATGTTTAGSDQGYINLLYNNIWNISNNSNTNTELLVANGAFTTNHNPYYTDYSIYNGNIGLNSGINYSTLSGTKYATFAWKVNSLSGTYTNLYFVLNMKNALYYNSTDQSFYFDNTYSKPLRMFYRYETNTNFTATSSNWGTFNNGTSYYANTTWISFNANSSQGITLLATLDNITNYNNATTICNQSLVVPTSNQNPGNVTFQLNNPQVYLNTTAYLYLRIGIPDGYDAFSNVSAYLS
jgi:hypothetical protein